MSLSVDIEKRLGSFHLDVHFESSAGTTALLGASGCGKSMTLKCIAGIATPDRGRIVLGDRVLFDSEQKINLSPQQRRVGYLFQQYALFPNMTVEQNILCGIRSGTRAEKKQQLSDKLRLFGLEGMEKKYPAQLSGGQQQRVALARILCSEPEAILLDEPFSALDSHLRFRLEQEVRELLRQFGKTVLLVSHDRDEVFRLSEKIAVMCEGHVEVFGDKKDVFAEPATRNAAILTGCKNVSPIRRLDERHVLALDWDIPLETAKAAGSEEYLGIRMNDIAAGPGQNAFLCDVAEEIENPFTYTIMLRPCGHQPVHPIGWELGKAEWQRLRSQQVWIHIPAESAVLLRGE